MIKSLVETELGCECKKCNYQWSIFNKDKPPEVPKKCPNCDNSKITVVYKACRGKNKKDKK